MVIFRGEKIFRVDVVVVLSMHVEMHLMWPFGSFVFVPWPPWLCCTLLPPPGNGNQYCVLLAPKRPSSCTRLLQLLLVVDGKFHALAFCEREHRAFGSFLRFMSSHR